MANTPTLLNTWPGPGGQGEADALARLTYAINILDQRTALLSTSGITTNPAPITTYTLATLPSTATFVGRLIIVSDATPANSLCVSDGTNWKFVSFGATVS